MAVWTERKYLVGIDIGGTKIALGLGETEQGLLHRGELPTPPDPVQGVRLIAAAVQGLMAAAGADPGDLAGVGIGCVGPLDTTAGLVLNPPNLPGWWYFPLQEAIAGALDCPAYLENDANTAALGEHRYGAGQGFADLVYLTLGTGIGGGVIINHRLLTGMGGGAGELGHMTIIPDGGRCNCGNNGCLEALASGPAIARRAREGLRQGGSEPLLALTGGDPDRITARMVGEAAANGDPLASRILAETIEYLGIGIGNVLTLLSPEAVIIGGGVAGIGPPLIDGIKAIVRRRVKLVPVEQIAIVPAKLGTDAGVYGALALAGDQIGHQETTDETRVRRTRWEGED